MAFRDYSYDILRQNRNDLLIIKNNLLIPEDIDRGPNEDCIKIQDIIIPPWLRVCEIPTNVEGMSDQRKAFLDVIDQCTTLIDAIYPHVRDENVVKFTDSAIDLNAIHVNLTFLQKSFDLLFDAFNLIPVNYNMYLIRVLAYANVLKGKVEPLMTHLVRLRDNDPTISTMVAAETDVAKIFSDVSEYLRDLETHFENGMLCADYDTELYPDATRAMEILSNLYAFFSKFDATGTYTYLQYQQSILGAQNTLLAVVTTDYHLERSKAPFKTFNTTSANEGGYIPKLPYDYVHQRYYVEVVDPSSEVVDYVPHMYEHDGYNIGDIII